MEVILLEKIGRLGNLGDKVSIKSGYGRNYLIPQGKALSATAANVSYFEERRIELEQASADRLTAAQGRAKAIEAIGNVTIAANASDEGRLFGSVGTRDIAEALTRQGVDVKKSEVNMPDGVLREVGEFELTLQLSSEVSQDIKVTVVGQ